MFDICYLNNELGFDFTDEEILLDSGWQKSQASMFDIVSERNVFDEVFYFGSDKDYLKLLQHMKEKPMLGKVHWSAFVLTKFRSDWTERDFQLFNITYQDGYIDEMLFKAYKTLKAVATDEIRNLKRKERTSPVRFYKVGEEPTEKEEIKYKNTKEYYGNKEIALLFNYFKKAVQDLEKGIINKNKLQNKNPEREDLYKYKRLIEGSLKEFQESEIIINWNIEIYNIMIKYDRSLSSEFSKNSFERDRDRRFKVPRRRIMRI